MVKARAKLLDVNIKSGLVRMSDQHCDLSRNAADGIIRLANELSALTFDEACNICAELSDTLFVPADAQRVRDVINTKVDMVEPTVAEADTPKQSHDYMYNYLTGSDWLKIRSATTAVEISRVLAIRSNSIGYVKVSEIGFKKLASLAIWAASCDLGNWLTVVRQLKLDFSRINEAVPPEWQGPLHFDPSPTSLRGDFPRIYAKAYGDDHPCAHPPELDIDTYHTVLAHVPCRSSRAGYGRASPRPMLSNSDYKRSRSASDLLPGLVIHEDKIRRVCDDTRTRDVERALVLAAAKCDSSQSQPLDNIPDSSLCLKPTTSS